MKDLEKKIQYFLNLFKSRDLSKAELYGKELLKVYPKVTILYNILGLVLTYQKKIDEAILWYERGIGIEPGYAMIHNNLGSIYKSKEEYIKAEKYYKKSISLDSKISEPQNNLGNLYVALNKHEKAINCYKKALIINPKFLMSHYNLGVVYKNIGKFKEAKKHLKSAVKLNPYFCTAHRILSQVIKYKKDDKHFNILKKIIEDKKIIENQKKEIAFALGKAFEDTGDFKKAFNYFSMGNKLHKKNSNFNIQDEKKEFDWIKKVFNTDLFNKFKKYGYEDTSAIFILGMPRSGTTLVEQILSSHPKVFGGDELNLLPNLVKKHLNNVNSNLFSTKILNIDKDKLKSLGKEYIISLKNISNNSEKITDKFLINFKFIGLIKLILPKSKIIHCIRNPKDNCLSIYKNYFVNPKLDFAYNLNDILEYNYLYKDLMKHWEKNLPSYVINIKYEKLIENPKQQIHNLLKACDLNWSDKCLKYYNNKRPIKTASDTQARKKIYNTSLNQWKNYEKYLKDFFDKLQV